MSILRYAERLIFLFTDGVMGGVLSKSLHAPKGHRCGQSDIQGNWTNKTASQKAEALTGSTIASSRARSSPLVFLNIFFIA